MSVLLIFQCINMSHHVFTDITSKPHLCLTPHACAWTCRWQVQRTLCQRICVKMLHIWSYIDICKFSVRRGNPAAFHRNNCIPYCVLDNILIQLTTSIRDSNLSFPCAWQYKCNMGFALWLLRMIFFYMFKSNPTVKL